MHVSKYAVTRHYGGPEEGGWYYDRYEYVSTLFFDMPLIEARRKAAKLNEKAKEEKRQPSGFYQGRGSVANHTDEVYMEEATIAQYDTTNDSRPFYQ